MLTDGVGVAIAQHSGEYLVDVGPDLLPRARLATAWTPSQGGKVWTITVRRGVMFQSGKPLTADDVVATFKRLVDPKGSSSAKSSLGFLTPEGVEKVDAHTVRFTLQRTVVDFPYYLNIYQAIILPTTYSGNSAKDKDGTGPYKLVEYVPGERARFTRNPNYWNKPLPYLDGVEIVLGFSTGGQAPALLSGNVDTVIVTDYTHIQTLKGNARITISAVPSSGHDGIFLRTDKPPFSDLRVRQAMALAMDRVPFIDNLNNGLAVLGDDNVIAPVFPIYSSIGQRSQDLARAKALLAAAGHPNGFATTIVTASDAVAGLLASEAVLVGQMLKQIGIDAKVMAEPSKIYYNTDWLTAPLTISDWAHRPTPSQFINVAYRGDAPWNASHWKNPRFDTLAKQLDSTIDLSRRKAIARQIELLQTEQTPSIIPYFSKIARPVSSRFRNVQAHPSNYLDLSRAYVAG